jgi:hypothetical protein
LPLFEHTLTDLHRSNPLAQRIQGPYKYTVWDEPDEPEFSDDEEGWAAYDREMRNWEMTRPIQLPDIPDAGYPGGLERRNYVMSLKGRKLQAIVQVSDTRLVGGILYINVHTSNPPFFFNTATRRTRVSWYSMAC